MTHQPLTSGQRTILRLIADGHTDVEIAARMGTSKGAVRSNVFSLCRRIGARHRAHAVAIGFREGLVT